MSRKKILFLSDAVSSSSGLGRITRDLAIRLHAHGGFEVATVGYGGNGSKSLPFQQYHLHSIQNWLVPELPAVWNDFVGDDEGILMCIWDLSRLYWLGMPQTCPDPGLRHWVENAKVKKWAYHAIDAEGPMGKLSHRIASTMKGFDRVLDYSAFSTRITGNPEHLPHGIDTSVFYPRDHAEARRKFMMQGFQGLNEDSLLIGIVATNQTRKNWQLGMETCRILLDRGHDVRLWAHTDILQRYWDIGSLVVDYGLQGRAAITAQRFTDEQLAWMYAACDATLCIGPEGFGFPAAESLACGVPTVAGSYGAQAEFVPAHMQVKPVAFYYEGAFCSKRPVHEAAKWADKVLAMKGARGKSLLPERVDWHGPALWPAWIRWFEEGVEPSRLPSAADLDAVAAEEAIR
ncbi:MAG: glycosyltransferase [Terriglobales bacterium]